jgi:xylulokinase
LEAGYAGPVLIEPYNPDYFKHLKQISFDQAMAEYSAGFKYASRREEMAEENKAKFLSLIRRHDWSDEILEAAGVSRDKLGVPIESGIILGKLDKRTAGLLGLHEGVAVVSGGHDVPCFALGSGILSAGTACTQAGTYEGISSVVDSPNTSESALSSNLNTYCHVLKGKYISLVLFPAGFATKWFVTQFCEAGHDGDPWQGAAGRPGQRATARARMGAFGGGRRRTPPGGTESNRPGSWS